MLLIGKCEMASVTCRSSTSSCRGFTLIEIAVAMACLAALAGLSFPVFQSIRETARQSECRNNLRNIGIAMHSWSASHRRLPPGTLGYAESLPWKDFRKTEDYPYWKFVQHTSFLVLISTHLGEESLTSELNPAMLNPGRDLRGVFNRNGTSVEWFGLADGFRRASDKKIESYFCPGDNLRDIGDELNFYGGSQPVREGPFADDNFSFLVSLQTELPGKYQGSNYLGCSGACSGGIHPDPARNEFRGAMSSGAINRISDIPDGASSTIMVGETLGAISNGTRTDAQAWTVGGLARGRGSVPWGIPRSHKHPTLIGNLENASAFGFASAHSSVANFLMVDGSIRAIDREIEWIAFYRLCGGWDGGGSPPEL